jgi:transcriptional regulator with XRE-family HTH domain
MYKNLVTAMKAKGVTYTQIAELLNCRYQTISDRINGNTETGFLFEDAVKIKKIFFPEYDMEFLYVRANSIA